MVDIASIYDREKLKLIPDLVALDFGRAGESRGNVFLIRARFSKKSRVSPSLLVMSELDELPPSTHELALTLFAMHAGVLLPELKALQGEIPAGTLSAPIVSAKSADLWIARHAASSAPDDLRMETNHPLPMRLALFGEQKDFPQWDRGLIFPHAQERILTQEMTLLHTPKVREIVWNDGSTAQRRLSPNAVNAVASALRRFKSA